MRTLRQVNFLSLLVCILALATSVSRLSAQVATGRITGRVTDSTGAVVAGATVSLTSDTTSVVQTVRTGGSGDYVFEAVNPGSYTLKVVAPGFAQYTQQGIQAHIQDNLTIDVKLAVGTVGQQVSVSAAVTPLLQEEDASVGQTIDEEQVNNMPLQSRDWTTLGLLSAGASTTAGSSNAEFNVNGGDWTQNDFRLDGIDDNVEIYGGGDIQGASGNNGYTQFVPPPDAIQEFKLQSSNFSAEFGHSAGAIVNAALKSGTNGLHGDLWEYVRNTVFNANDYFANQTIHRVPPIIRTSSAARSAALFTSPSSITARTRPSSSSTIRAPGSIRRRPVPPVSQVSGCTAAISPISRIIFSLVSGTKTDALGRVYPLATILDPATTRMVAAGATDPVSGLANTTSSAVYVRDPFFTNGSVAGITNFTGYSQYLNILPQGRLDPNAVKLLGLYPNPTPGRTSFPNYYQFAAGTNNINQYDVRIDENISTKDIIFGVFNRSNETVYAPPYLPGYAEGQNYGDGDEEGPRYGIVLGYTHVFTPTLTNEFHIGFLHTIERLNGVYGNTPGIPAQFGIPGVPQTPGNGGLPPINITGLTGHGSSRLDAHS